MTKKTTQRKPKKRRHKGELTILSKLLDGALRQYVLVRDGYTCQWCGKKPKVVTDIGRYHTSHVIPKHEGHALRWDVKNVMLLCYKCHLERWHKNTLEAADWFINKFPDRYEYLWPRREWKKEFSIEARKRLLELLKLKTQLLLKGK